MGAFQNDGLTPIVVSSAINIYKFAHKVLNVGCSHFNFMFSFAHMFFDMHDMLQVQILL